MTFFDKSQPQTESVFNDIIALDFDYQPKLVPFRENHQFTIASCIKPLFSNRPGKNLLIFGGPGVGKTVSLKHVLQEIGDEGMDDQVLPVYVNCWKNDSSYKIALSLCEQLGYKFTTGKNTNHLLREVIKLLNKQSTVICLDEADKLKEVDALYSLVEDVQRKTNILITNDKSWYDQADTRLKSRFAIMELSFAPYTFDEVAGILKQRCEYALVPGVLDESAFELITQKTFDAKDLRKGLAFLREAGTIAEESTTSKILLSHASSAIKSLSASNIKEPLTSPNEKKILHLVKEEKDNRLVDLYDKFKTKHPKYEKSYKTFKRTIQSLEKKGVVKTKNVPMKQGGNSTLVEYLT